MATKHPRSKLGFTLIELLTVIAIIGILAAILIPTVGAVKKRAQGASCTSRLRQIGIAMSMHADENKGMVPPWRGAVASTEGGAQGVLWTQALIRYTSVPGSTTLGSPVLPVLPDGSDYASNPQYFYMCPGGELPTRGRSWGNYAVHPVIMRNNSAGPFFKLNSVARPSQVILVADGSQSDQGDNSYFSLYGAASDGSHGYFNRSYTSSDTGRALDAPLDVNNPDRDRAGSVGFLRYRHGNNVNCLFVDGHVASKPRGSLTFGNVIENR